MPALQLQAQLGLGRTHYLGQRGVAPNARRARPWLEKAEEQGDATASALLGHMHLNGLGGETGKGGNGRRSYKKALRHFRDAADGGNAGGQTGIGFMYLRGAGVARNYTRAAMFLQVRGVLTSQCTSTTWQRDIHTDI